ncbi:MAG: hypothetical protein GY749_18480 [Desulfobacteraceae bacterium]|nr:hypothetical protein [Desulfobacteraceae bacterium]
MNTLLALICLTGPFIFFGLKAVYTYGQDIEEIFTPWKIPKIIAFSLFVLYILSIIVVGHKEIAGIELNFPDSGFIRDDWFDCYIAPSFSFSLIIFTRSASEIVVKYKEYLKVGLEEDAAFILGWASLIAEAISIIFFKRM